MKSFPCIFLILFSCTIYSQEYFATTTSYSNYDKEISTKGKITIGDKKYNNIPFGTYLDLASGAGSYMSFLDTNFKDRYSFINPIGGQGRLELAISSDNNSGSYQHKFGVFVIDRNGNIGINTTHPSERFQVNGTSYFYGVVKGNQPGGALRVQGNYGYLDLGARNGDWAHIYTDRPAIIFNKDIYTTSNAFSSYNDDLVLKTRGAERLRIDDSSGNIGIGTKNLSGYKLTVNGNIRAKEIKVETGWADFVFEENYDLPTLEEVERHIKAKGYLKDVPSAKEVSENGILLGDMNSRLLQKIEELTLYAIAQNKEIELLKRKQENQEELFKRIEKLENFIENKLR